MWIEPIVDRTAADAAAGNAKGCCNVADLERLEGNVALLAQLLELTVTQRGQPWTAKDFVTDSELRRIVENVAALRNSYPCYSITPPAPQHPLNRWDKWNAAEQILQDIRRLYDDRRAARQFCGELGCGQRIGVI
ncbi:MAG: hypothetical protein RR276_06050 [Angelakisella sp.]